MRLRSPFKALRDDGGNVALIAALCLLPLIFAIGMSIDLSNATRVRLALQDATDSAALAMARNAATITDANAAAKNYIDASYNKNTPFTLSTATINKTTLTVQVDARANVPTMFAGILGKSVIPVTAHSVAQGQGFDYEIAMVLDNSGSMASALGAGSTKIAELKKAATALLDAMITDTTTGKVKIGIVPFASSVKVGSTYKTAAWLDTAGLAGAANENWYPVQVKKRMELFSTSTNGMSGVSWDGCVESRPIKVGGVTKDYDVNDALPTTTTPDTLFTPWFAPDEPDQKDGWWNDSYSNNYLNDDGGSCSGSTNASSNLKAQGQVCKYKNAVPDTSNGKGPNYMCDSTAITPLTNSRSALDTAVTNLTADGNTNVGEGLAWGWRVLSPTAPFTEGKAYTTPKLTKIILLMTDGQNNIPGRNTQNDSIYSSYGFMSKGRIGATSNNTATIQGKMDERLLLACTNAKAAGIVIYTVALGADADADLLKTCASKSEFAYAPTTGAELTPVFQAIAASINQLRLSQ